MATKPPLSHLGDLSIADFMADYWHKKPLLIRNAFTDFEPPISADELAGLACEELVESRFICVDNDKQPDSWRLEEGPFDDDFFARLPEKDWTLLVQAVDHWVPDASDFLELFRFIPRWRMDDLMISYAAKGGGVGPHYDNYDVFLLQVEGQRRWEVGGIYGEHSDIEEGKPVRILSDWQPEQSWVLEPGDMLYLPPCVGHNGVAETDGCVTYSIGYRAPQTGDMLADFAATVADSLNQEDRYADADLSLRLNSGEITQSDLLRVQSLFRRFIDDPERVATWFGQLMTQPKYPEHEFFNDEPLVLRELLDEIDGIRRNEGARFAYWQSADNVHLFVNSQSWALPIALLPVVQLLAEGNEYPLSVFADYLADEDVLDLLQTLLDQDAIYLV